jgi:Phosphotransferase enzyme family
VRDDEVPLRGGDVTEGVVRVGATVRRPRGPWSDSVAAYLRHLESAGFGGAPRHLGVDEQGRDILDFIPGDVASQPVVESWATSDDALAGVARLLRHLHAASASFVPPPGSVWFGEDLHLKLSPELPPEESPELVSHFDVTPQNVVFRDGAPIGLIDFDLTRPGTRLRDVANTATHWVPVKPAEDRDPAFMDADAVARLAVFVDAYGLGLDDRSRLVDLMIHGAARSWHRMKANAEYRGGGWTRMWEEGVGDQILRRHAWLIEQRSVLEGALSL